jgi:threonyl-tRNA synthetase
MTTSSPEQEAVAPISQEQADYAAEVMAMFEGSGFRAASYNCSGPLSCRIVAAHEAEVPVVAILGDAKGLIKIASRSHFGGKQFPMWRRRRRTIYQERDTVADFAAT